MIPSLIRLAEIPTTDTGEISQIYVHWIGKPAHVGGWWWVVGGWTEIKDNEMKYRSLMAVVVRGLLGRKVVSLYS